MSDGFAFKPAPVAQKLRIRIENDALIVERAARGRRRRALSLSGLSSGRWRETGMGLGNAVIVERVLELKGANGAIVLRQGGGRPDGAFDQNTKEYLRAVSAALSCAARHTPDLVLALGPGPAFAWAMSAVGAAGAAIGLICAAAGIGALLSGAWLEGVFLAAAATAFGAKGSTWLVSHWPFRASDTKSAADISADLERRLA